MENHKETIERFKSITESLKKPEYWNSITLEMEIYEKESGRGFSAWSLDKKGDKVGVDADVNYEFSFRSKITLWHKETSIGERRWNKANFTIFEDGRYEVKTWWDAEFQKSLYGTED